MKAALIISLLALSFATGFTCSKNAPQLESEESAALTESAPAQEQMAAPLEEQNPNGVPAQPQEMPNPESTTDSSLPEEKE